MIPIVIPVGGGGKKVKTGSMTGSGTLQMVIPCDFEPADFIICYDLALAGTPGTNYAVYKAWKIGAANGGWGFESGGSNQHHGVDCSGSYSGGNFTITVTTYASTAVFRADWTYYYMLVE